METRKYHGHYKNKAGVIVPSVTTISGTYDKGDGLLMWAVNQTKMGNDHREVSRQEAKAGTLFHHFVNCYFEKKCDGMFESAYCREFTAIEIDRATNAYWNFVAWANKQNNLNVVASEMRLVSEIFQYGGQIDLYGIYEEKDIWVLDFKTSPAIYKSQWVQLSAYAKLLEEVNGLKVKEMHILSCFKDKQGYSHEFGGEEHIETYFEIFLNLRRNYDLDKKVSQLKTKKVLDK